MSWSGKAKPPERGKEANRVRTQITAKEISIATAIALWIWRVTTKRDGVNLGKRRRCFSFKLIVTRLIFQIIAYSSNAARVIREGAAHLNKRDTTPPLAWLWRIRGAYTSAWFNSCNVLHVYAVKSRMRVQTQCGQGRNEASENQIREFQAHD